MKSSYRIRLLAVATAAVGRRAALPPALVFVHHPHLELLARPNPTEAEMENCRARGGRIVHVHFVNPKDISPSSALAPLETHERRGE
jgi:hypothetical protein